MNEQFAPIGDMITLIANHQAGEATVVLNELLGARVTDALASHKQSIAQSLFVPSADALAEESEQLDELSRETLGSYAKKATGQAIMHAASLGNAKTKAGVQRAEKPLEKRSKGIFRAISKLAKEESEQLDEISAATAYSAGRKRLAQGRDLTNASLDAYKDPKHAAYTTKQYAKQADTAFGKAKKNYGYALKKDKIGFHEESEQDA